MSGLILDGNEIARKIKKEILAEISCLKQKGRIPSLVSILVGETPASRVYTDNQKRVAGELGICYKLERLRENTTGEELAGYIGELNEDKTYSGILLQLPLPPHIDGPRMQKLIFPSKDVEGIHPENLGKLVLGEINIVPATASSVLEIVKSSGISIKGKETVIVGHSSIVGKPSALLFLSSLMESATVTVCHIATTDLRFHTRRADILIVAAGKPGFIKKDFVKEGAFVIDVGINRVPLLDGNGNPVLTEDGKKKMKTVGDVDFENVKDIAGIITPVPGGVGPLTVMMLYRNLVRLSGSI